MMDNNTYKFPLPPTRLRSQSGPDHLIAPTSKSRACHNSIHSVVLKTANKSHQITILSPDIKYKRELAKTKATLKQLQTDYTDLIELTEAETLFHETRECILNDKLAILENLVAEYKEKYQQIAAKNKYIDNERDSLDIDIPILEIDVSGSNERVTALQQSLHVANENISRKDNKMKALKEQLTNWQRTSKLLTQTIEQLQLECYQSYGALESQIGELTEQNLMLKKEKKDLQDLLEGKQDMLFKNDTKFHSMIGLSSPSASDLDGLNNMFDNAIEPLVMVRLPSASYHKRQTTNGFRMDDDMHTIEEEHDVNNSDQLSVSDKQFSASQDSRSMGVMSDGEEDVVEQLMQNDEFINCDAVKHLTKYNIRDDDDIMAQFLQLTACAVKVKYSHSKIKTDDLIRRVKNCSFYQYYDQMVRILQMEKKTNNMKNKCERIRPLKRHSDSIMNLKSIKSVTKNIKQWEKQSLNSSVVTENKSSCKRNSKKRKSKTNKKNNYYKEINKENIYNDNSMYNTMIYRKDDIQKATELYSSECQ